MITTRLGDPLDPNNFADVDARAERDGTVPICPDGRINLANTAVREATTMASVHPREGLARADGLEGDQPMRKLTQHDIKDLREYERERQALRAEIIGVKQRRRIALGDLMSIVFENAATMRFQIQEMARAERMLRDEQIAQELETYNELIPEDGELSGTLFIEIDDPDSLQYWLPRLVGIHEHLHFALAGATITGQAQDVDRLTRADTTPTVHYFKFHFTPEQQRSFAEGPVRILVDHPEYGVDVELTEEQRDELVGDFAA